MSASRVGCDEIAITMANTVVTVGMGKVQW